MITTAILTISDSSAAGLRPDRSGPALRERVEELGWRVMHHDVVPDVEEAISERLRRLADHGHVSVILTTGGTGVAPRDVTPEATRTAIDREIPGLAELIRAEGRRSTPFAALTRGIAGSRGVTLIVNLPGSPRGAIESFDAVANLIPHVVDLLQGRTDHAPESNL